MTVLASIPEPGDTSSPLVALAAFVILATILGIIYLRGHLGGVQRSQDPLESMSEAEFRAYVDSITQGGKQ